MYDTYEGYQLWMHVDKGSTKNTTNSEKIIISFHCSSYFAEIQKWFKIGSEGFTIYFCSAHYKH